MELKIFINVPKAVSVLKISYVLGNKKNTNFLDKKVIKMGSKSKKDILSMQDILIMLFGRGGGGSQPFWGHFSFKSFPITPYKKIPSASLL